MNCIFCAIAGKEIPSDIVFEDESVIAFRDISPAAPVHVLIIPKEHIASVREISGTNSGIIAHIYEIAVQLAKELGIFDKGFRMVTNCGEDGGQTVGHLHFHLLGGRSLKWPPG
ncbi:MAG: HIT-like protein [Firmicutes bacterium ADurb.Bin193]|nr:MAG: HIT-like protein [Firmicutes bacterium ADurb.Bin193]